MEKKQKTPEEEEEERRIQQVSLSLEAGLREEVVALGQYAILRGAGPRLDLASSQARADREKWDPFSETNTRKEMARRELVQAWKELQMVPSYIERLDPIGSKKQFCRIHGHNYICWANRKQVTVNCCTYCGTPRPHA